MPAVTLWGWCTDPAGWVKVLVDDTGRLIIDPSAILEDDPTDGETEKAPTSNWAHDHEAAMLAAAVHGNTTLARVYLGTDQENIQHAKRSRVQLDTEEVDLGNNFSVAVWYDEVQADADSDATHIEDDDGAFVAIGLIYALVTWASDSPPTANIGTGYITAVDSDTLTINKASGADFGPSYYYTIYHAEYTAPISGYYYMSATLTYHHTTVVADKSYNHLLMVGATIVATDARHSANTDRLSSHSSIIYHLDAGDIVKVASYHFQGTNATLELGTHLTNFQIFLVQAD